MAPTLIIERFDVEEKIGTGLVAGTKHTIVHPLAFQGTEEAFYGALSYQLPTPFMLAWMLWPFNSA